MNKNIIGINCCVKDCHEAAVKGGWWHDADGKKKDRNAVSYTHLTLPTMCVV